MCVCDSVHPVCHSPPSPAAFLAAPPLPLSPHRCTCMRCNLEEQQGSGGSGPPALATISAGPDPCTTSRAQALAQVGPPGAPELTDGGPQGLRGVSGSSSSSSAPAETRGPQPATASCRRSSSNSSAPAVNGCSSDGAVLSASRALDVDVPESGGKDLTCSRDPLLTAAAAALLPCGPSPSSSAAAAAQLDIVFADFLWMSVPAFLATCVHEADGALMYPLTRPPPPPTRAGVPLPAGGCSSSKASGCDAAHTTGCSMGTTGGACGVASCRIEAAAAALSLSSPSISLSGTGHMVGSMAGAVLVHDAEIGQVGAAISGAVLGHDGGGVQGRALDPDPAAQGTRRVLRPWCVPEFADWKCTVCGEVCARHCGNEFRG